MAEKDLLREDQLAKRWSLSPRTLQRWRQQGKGPPYLKMVGRVFYRPLDAEQWELSNLRQATKPTKLEGV
jgi:predicted site-specific integrase-resolvase